MKQISLYDYFQFFSLTYREIFVCECVFRAHRDYVGAKLLQVTPQQLHVFGVRGSGVHHKQFVTDLQVDPEPENKKRRHFKKLNAFAGVLRYM